MAKVILLKDVINLGQKGDLKEVKDGYVRNFLLPRKLAELATKANIRTLEAEQSKREILKSEISSRTQDDLEKLAREKIIFKMPANEKRHLFDSISISEIEAKLQELGIKNIKKEWIKLASPIKEVGESEFEIKPPTGEAASFKITVTEKKTPKKRSRKK